MTDTIKSNARKLADEMLAMNRTVADWQIAQSKRAEEQVEAAFEAQRSGVDALVTLHRDTTRAWLDLVAPAADNA